MTFIGVLLGHCPENLKACVQTIVLDPCQFLCYGFCARYKKNGMGPTVRTHWMHIKYLLRTQ